MSKYFSRKSVKVFGVTFILLGILQLIRPLNIPFWGFLFWGVLFGGFFLGAFISEKEHLA